jgi:hypothetical protein
MRTIPSSLVIRQITSDATFCAANSGKFILPVIKIPAQTPANKNIGT